MTDPTLVPPPIHVLYASATGNAENIAKTFHSRLIHPGQLLSLNEVANANLLIPDTTTDDTTATPAVVTCVIVSSTTGDGDIPENGVKLARFLRKLEAKDKDTPPLKGKMRYVLLGLGDTNYENFCGGAIKVDKMLKKYGAERIGKRVQADDATGLEDVVEPWYDQVASELAALLNVPAIFTSNNTSSSTTIPQSLAPQPPPATRDQLHDHDQQIENLSQQFKRSSLLQGQTPPSVVHDVPNLVTPLMRLTKLDTDINHTSPSPASLFLWEGEEIISCPVSDVIRLSAQPKDTDHQADQRVVWHMELDVPSTFQYAPGDNFAVFVPNDPQSVKQLLQFLHTGSGTASDLLPYDPHACFVLEKKSSPDATDYSPISPKATLTQLFAHRVTLGPAPHSKILLRALAEYCSDLQDKNTLLYLSSSSPESKIAYKNSFVQNQPSIMDILQYVPSCKPPPALLLELLRPLAPRHYSASSSLEYKQNKISFAHALVEFDVNSPSINTSMTTSTTDMNNNNEPLPATLPSLRRRRGHATGYFATICENWINNTSFTNGALEHQHLNAASNNTHARPMLWVSRKLETGVFAPPPDLSVPYVMIGPGTGVAPFIGFLQARQHALQQQQAITTTTAHAAEIGQTWLFFGCRHPDQDFLYKDTLQQMIDSNVLTHLHVAFSRLTETKCYVQDKMWEFRHDLAKLWMENPHSKIYLCGDGGNMAAQVDETIVKIITTYLEENQKDHNYIHQNSLNTLELQAKANTIVKEWVASKRYLKDVWYWGQV